MYRIRWREEALQSLQAIGNYIAENNPTAANRVVGRVFEAVDLAASHPLIFPQRGDYRVCPMVSPYLVFYRVVEAEKLIVVVDVIHAARNYESA